MYYIYFAVKYTIKLLLTVHVYIYLSSPTILPVVCRLLGVVLGVHTALHVHRASLTDTASPHGGGWSFLRLAALAPRDIATIMLGDFTKRYTYIQLHVLSVSLHNCMDVVCGCMA